ncbi:MAG: hypothetical protein OEZ02_13255 [Anaerolineae bacterium]|nr:hypothetical protein [Anaerolineae bacterium]
MKINIKSPISVSVAMIAGGIVLLGYFFPMDSIPALNALYNAITTTAMLLAAVALLLGIFNLLSVHLGKVSEASNTAVYSLFLVGALLTTFGATLYYKPDGFFPSWLFEYVQIPIETSLMAVLTVSLISASMRVLNQRITIFSMLFLFSATGALLSIGPVFGFNLPIIGKLLDPVASGGARGILLGVALGTIATGLRILMGSDRPYGE